MSTAAPLLSSLEIERLVAGKAITSLHPWQTNDEDLVDDHLRSICTAITNGAEAKSRIEWNHYGSGYASYVDAWFYKGTTDFRVKTPLRYGEEHIGLVVLLSRLSPYFVLMEAEKRWHPHGGSSYLPAFEMMDEFSNPSVDLLGKQVQKILESNGFVRVLKEQLSQLLPTATKIETNLSSGALRHFDALFYWYD